jgi:phage terminase Nu1 subunit (DNA packaging protein)
MTITAGALAQMFDMSAQAFGQLAKQNKLVKNSDGMFPLQETVRWYVARLREQRDEPDSKSDSQARLADAKARMMEIQLSREMAESITVEDAVSVLGESLTAIKSQLLSIPSKLAPQIMSNATTAEKQDLLDKYINEVLEELATIPERINNTAEVHDTEQEEIESTNDNKRDS